MGNRRRRALGLLARLPDFCFAAFLADLAVTLAACFVVLRVLTSY